MRDLLHDVHSYYDETHLDFMLLWAHWRSLAFHFGFYDDGVRGHGDALANMNRVLAERAGIGPGSRVLDAGCGVGGSALWIAENYAAHVTGISLVRKHVVAGRRLVRARSLGDRVTLLQGDFTDSPFDSDSFDAILAIESLCHARDKEKFYAEAVRLLRPGGCLVVAEYMRAGRYEEPGTQRMVRRWLDGWAIPDIDSPARHIEYGRRAGLTAVEVQDVTQRVRPSLRRLYRLARSTYPLARLGRTLRLRSAVQHANVVSSILQYRALRADAWLYAILSARKPVLERDEPVEVDPPDRCPVASDSGGPAAV